MKRVSAWMSTVRPDDANRDRVAAGSRCRGASARLPSCAADVRPVFGVATTLLLPCGVPVNASVREPRVLRQRAADLIHDVRPDEAIFVEALDDVHLAEQRVAHRFGAIAILEEVRIARRVAAPRDPLRSAELGVARASAACTGTPTAPPAAITTSDRADEELVPQLARRSRRQARRSRRAWRRVAFFFPRREKIDFESCDLPKRQARWAT